MCERTALRSAEASERHLLYSAQGRDTSTQRIGRRPLWGFSGACDISLCDATSYRNFVGL